MTFHLFEEPQEVVVREPSHRLFVNAYQHLLDTWEDTQKEIKALTEPDEFDALKGLMNLMEDLENEVVSISERSLETWQRRFPSKVVNPPVPQ